MGAKRGRWWIFRRHLWQHWRESAIIFLVLLSGFLFYTFYGSWSGAVASPDEGISALSLPADVMLEIAHWAAQMQEPDLSPAAYAADDFLRQRIDDRGLWGGIPTAHRPAQLPRLVRESLGAVSAPIMTGAGTVDMWGISGVPLELEASLPLVAGRWPEDASEAAVHESLANGGGVVLGERTPLVGMQVLQGSTREVPVEVVGVFRGEHDIYPRVMVLSETAAELLGGGEENLLLLWEQKVEPIEVEMIDGTMRYEFPGLSEVLRGFSWSTRVPTIEAFDTHEDLDSLTARLGVTLPFGMLVEGRVRVHGSAEIGIRAMYMRLGERLAPVTLMILLSQVVALTVILAIIVVDRQRTFGAYKVLGLSVSQVRRLYFGHVLVIGVTAGVLGFIIFNLTAGFMEDLMGFDFEMPLLSIGLWGLIVLLLSAWCAHIAGALFESTDIDSLLREAYEFDWWSIVRMKAKTVRDS